MSDDRGSRGSSSDPQDRVSEPGPPHPLAAVRSRAVDTLARARVPTPEADAELLIAHILGLGRGELQAKAVTGAEVPPDRLRAVLDAVERRAAREPLQHITGRAPFRQVELAVGPGVFVPRPETEFVAQLAIDSLQAVPHPEPSALDAGTGSGAIAIALATEVPHARVVAVENSPAAFVWARQNARSLAGDNLRLVFGDVGEVLSEADAAFDVVVSNPPYIPDAAVPRDPEVRWHDPEPALYGGGDGLDLVRVISRRARFWVRPGGVIVLEHGEQQGAAIRDVLTADGWRMTATHRDLLGRDRATTATR